MTKQRVLMASLVVVAALTAAASLKAVSPDRRVVLTFSGPVGLPGVTIAAGSYTFEVANPLTSADVVRVFGTQGVVYMNFADRVTRPDGLASNAAVRFGEVKPGSVPPIAEWYPTGEKQGYRFRYSHQ
jgi:hypothetical protein